MIKKFYLIHGIYFQNGFALSLGFRPSINGLTTIDFEMTNAMYDGIVEPNVTNSTKKSFHGTMNDIYGNSKIINFEVSEFELKFIKQYEKRPPISYLFTRKENNVWIGTFDGIDCGTGITKCIITEIDDSFFISE